MDRLETIRTTRQIHRAWTEQYGSDPYSWGDGIVFFRITPHSMWAYAFHPEEFPEAAAPS